MRPVALLVSLPSFFLSLSAAIPTSSHDVYGRAGSPTRVQLFDVGNANLTGLAASSPTGPPAFVVADPPVRDARMVPLDAYLIITTIVAELAVDDFAGTLPPGVNTWQFSSIPGIRVGISSRGGLPRIPRRYALWALAHIMEDLLEHEFRGGRYALSFAGGMVGQVVVVTLPAATNEKAPTAAVASFNGQSVRNSEFGAGNSSTGLGAITQTYDFNVQRFDTLTQATIYMSTIGALVMLAEKQDQNLGMFVGSWDNIRKYQAIHVYHAPAPSRLTKTLLAQMMLNIAIEVKRRNEHHPCRTTLRDDRGLIAEGGYLVPPFPGTSLNVA